MPPELPSSSTPGSPGSVPPLERVRTACAYGNYEDLREAAEEDASLLDSPDEMGYYPLQWAALNNRVSIITFLIDKSVDVNRYTLLTARLAPVYPWLCKKLHKPFSVYKVHG